MGITDAVTTKKAGRPKSLAPLSSADKQKAYRARQQQKLEATNSLTAEIDIVRKLLLTAQEELINEKLKLEAARTEIIRLERLVYGIK
jgi:hypothetical protein